MKRMDNRLVLVAKSKLQLVLVDKNKDVTR